MSRNTRSVARATAAPVSPPPEEPFITSREAADLVGIKPPAIVRAAREGRIPAYLCGVLGKPRYKFRRSEVLATVRRVEPKTSKKARRS
jgi:excisionase family DNA binding protein